MITHQPVVNSCTSHMDVFGDVKAWTQVPSRLTGKIKGGKRVVEGELIAKQCIDECHSLEYSSVYHVLL